MLALKILLILIETICALLLIGIILLQKTKGEGLGLAFGAEMGESIFGARASNVLVKITAWLGVIFLANTLILGIIYSKGARRSSLLGRGKAPAPAEQSALPQTEVPQTALPPAAMPPAALPQAALPSTPPGTPAPSGPAEATLPAPAGQ